jgi:hypothetical protein
MNPAQDPWTRVLPHCAGTTRVLVMRHVQDDTYAVYEDGEVSLSDSANLILLLKQLSGREIP